MQVLRILHGAGRFQCVFFFAALARDGSTPLPVAAVARVTTQIQMLAKPR